MKAKITYVGDDFQEGLHVIRVGYRVYGPFRTPDEATKFADQYFVGAKIYLHPLRSPEEAKNDTNDEVADKQKV